MICQTFTVNCQSMTGYFRTSGFGYTAPALVIGLLLAGCGGRDSDPAAPPPPSATTFALELTGATTENMRSATAVHSLGLATHGATASRHPICTAAPRHHAARQQPTLLVAAGRQRS